ncbi:hypothetical protein M8J75_013015 [Diaphorina citri]|nr:hypothetical protein M8J75_013015 [Diaphorina citri]
MELVCPIAGDPKCDITDPFNDPCGDAGLCSPQGSGYSCDCSKFKSTLYVPSQDPNSCGTKVQIFCRDDERAKCDKHGWCRTGYGGYSCLCDPGYHNQYCTGRSSGNMTYFQSPIVLFKNKAPIGSIRVIYILAQSIGTQPSFQIFDILEMVLSARLRRRDVSQTPNLRSLRDISQVANYLQQDKLLWRHEVHQRAQDMAMVPSDVKPVIKLQYPATKKDTVEYIFDNDGNFRGQPSQYVIVLKNRGRLEFKQTLYFFNAAEGNRSSCIPHLKLQDCSLDIPYFQRDSIVLRSYISPSIFCDKAVSMYNVMFQWNLYAGFQKLFNSNFPFNEHKPTFSSSEQNIIIRPFTLYQDKTLPYNVHTVFLESKLTIESETYVNNAMCQFKVITLDLIITIKGGSYRTHNVRQNLILNASLSYDPNESPNNQDLIFSWDCRNQNGITPTFCDKRESSNPILTIRSDLLAKGDTLTFNLTVLDGYRELSGTAAQSVYLEDTSFEIICVKNCEVESKKTDAIYLKCLPYHADKTLVWTVSDSNVAKIRQPNTTPDIFIIKPNTLEPGKGYVVTLADQNDKRYKSSFEIYVGEALKRGSCEIKPTNGTMGKTHFSIKCENYGEFGADYKLVYEFYQSDGTDLMILGFNYIGTIKSIVLTFGDVRVKIYDKLGNVIDERLTVQLENLETDDENIINITKTVEISRSLLDHPSMLRHIQVLTKMLPHMNSTQKEASSLQIISEIGHVFDDIENTLNYLLIRQVLTTLKYFLNTLKQIGEEEHYLVHKIVKYTGQYLQQSIKSIYERDMMISEMDSIITDVNLYQTNQIIHECFALIEMNKDSLLKDRPKDGMEFGIRYYSYMTSTRYLIDTLNYTGLTTQSRMFPQQQDVQFKSNMSESRIWNKIDSPERLSNLYHIPNDSNTYIALDKPFVDQFVQDTNLSLEVVILKKNLFWWFNPDDFGVNTTICGIYLNRVENRDFKPIHILDEPISIHLEVLNLSRADVEWNATKYEDHVATDVKNTGIGSHRIPDLTKWSAVYVKFKKASSAMNLIWTKEQRPSTDLFQNEPNLVANETSEFLLLPRLNVTDPGGNGEDGDIGDYFVGIVPEQKGNHEYTFEIYRIDCRRWINDKWIIDPYCMVNNRSTLDQIICDCRHMSKFSASVLVVPNLVDPIGDASLLLTVLDNPTPVIFVLAILLLYVILLIWARRKDKMDTKRGRIVILKDNCPSDEVPYLVTVYTGSRPYAGTTSDVCIQIFGTHEVSRVHLIQNPNKFTLQRGNDDWFLVLTPHHLGDIKRIRLWSNYSGKRPDWYCDQVEVRDIGTRKKYLFFVQRWLAVLKDEEFLEAEVLTHDKVDPRNIWTKMWERNVKSTIQEQHPAASFLIRHPRTAGTRVEKLSIVVSGIMTILVISLMFYEKSETDEETYEFFEYRLRDLVIGWESMVVEFITMGIIMYCFGKSRADTSKIKETIQVVDEDELIENKEDKEQNNSSNSKEKDASDKHGEHDGENREGKEQNNSTHSKESDTKDEHVEDDGKVKIDSKYVKDVPLKSVTDVLWNSEEIEEKCKRMREKLVRWIEEEKSSNETEERKEKIKTSRSRSCSWKNESTAECSKPTAREKNKSCGGYIWSSQNNEPKVIEDINVLAQKYVEQDDICARNIFRDISQQMSCDREEINQLRKRYHSCNRDKVEGNNGTNDSRNEVEKLPHKEENQKTEDAKQLKFWNRQFWEPLTVAAKLRSYLSDKVLSKAVIEPFFPTSIEKREKFLPKGKKAWYRLAWTLLVINIVVSAYLIILYGLKFGRTKAMIWVTTTVLGFGQDFFLSTPFQVILWSFVLAKFYQRTQKTYLYYVNSEFYKEKFKIWQERDPEYIDLVNLNRQKSIYRPFTAKETCIAREYKQREDKQYRKVRDFLICMLGLIIIFTIIDFKFISMTYYSTKFYEHALLSAKSSNGISFRDIRNQKTLYEFLSTTLLPALYSVTPDVHKNDKINTAVSSKKSTRRLNDKKVIDIIKFNKDAVKTKGKTKGTKTSEKNKPNIKSIVKNASTVKIEPKESPKIIDSLKDTIESIKTAMDSSKIHYDAKTNTGQSKHTTGKSQSEVNTSNIDIKPRTDTKTTHPLTEHQIDLYNTKLISVLRIRQQRVKPNSCRVSKYFSEFKTSCNDNISPMSEDTDSYEGNWMTAKTDETEIEEATDLSLPLVKNPWLYQSEEITNTATRSGPRTNIIYNGGGYVKDLGSSESNMAQGLSQMIIHKWLDERTRVTFIECSLYNPNINAIIAVSLMIERLGSLNYMTDSEIGIMKLITSADFEIFEIRFKCILFALLIILYVFQLIHLTRYGLLSKNILYDLLILMFTIATLPDCS